MLVAVMVMVVVVLVVVVVVVVVVGVVVGVVVAVLVVVVVLVMVERDLCRKDKGRNRGAKRRSRGKRVVTIVFTIPVLSSHPNHTLIRTSTRLFLAASPHCYRYHYQPTTSLRLERR